MNIDQASFPASHECIAMDAHEARLAYQRDLCFAQSLLDRVVERLARVEPPMRYHLRRHTGRSRVLQSFGSFDVGDHENDFSRVVRRLACGKESGEVATSSRNEDRTAKAR